MFPFSAQLTFNGVDVTVTGKRAQHSLSEDLNIVKDVSIEVRCGSDNFNGFGRG